MPNIRLFPQQFLDGDACFGLFSLGKNGQMDLPVTIEANAGLPIHIIHSDPEHLAYLTGLLVLQAWIMGIHELGIPPKERKPILVVTDKPGQFGEAYLRLHVPIDRIKKLFMRRRVSLYQQGNSPSEEPFLDLRLGHDDTRTRLHNFFPAFQILGPSGSPRILAGREYLGRSDEGGPGVLITRKSDNKVLKALCERYNPFMAIFDAHGVAVQGNNLEMPSLFYHESIFSKELSARDNDKLVLCCLPDVQFEMFCSHANLCVVQPEESEGLSDLWKRADGALQALIERVDQRADRVVSDISRSATRLRNIMLSLPIGIRSYEQALIASGQPESLWYDWSVSQPLNGLENRLPEMAALGQWEELILQELTQAFREIFNSLEHDSPKRRLVLNAINESLGKNRRVALLVSSPSVATGLNWALRLPDPDGFGIPQDKVSAITFGDIRSMNSDQDCIIHQVFDPQAVFSSLAKAGPRQITFVLLRNELRFTGERFLRTRLLFPTHPANETILRPMYAQLERLEPVQSPRGRDRKETLLSDEDFEVVMRMFNQGPDVLQHGIVLTEDSEDGHEDLVGETQAFLVKLEGGCAVFLDSTGNVSYVPDDSSIRNGPVEILEPGHRLIIMNPTARESIAHRVLSSKKVSETHDAAGQLIARWREELENGIRRLDLTYRQVLEKIQKLGSRRLTPLVIGQWARGDVLGPLDASDIRRIGQVIESDWLIQNWQRVSLAMLLRRTGHRLLGRQVTRIIQKAAIGDYDLATKDEQFLKQLGVTMGELQDAVDLLTVEAISRETKLVPIEQVGKVVSV